VLTNREAWWWVLCSEQRHEVYAVLCTGGLGGSPSSVGHTGELEQIIFTSIADWLLRTVWNVVTFLLSLFFIVEKLDVSENLHIEFLVQ